MPSSERIPWHRRRKELQPSIEELRVQQTIQAYDQGVSHYKTNTVSDLNENQPARAWLDYVLEVLNQRPEVKDLPVLEIGSGTGRDADYFEKHGLSVKRTDLTPGFVQALNEQGHNAYQLNALTDELGGPYSMVFANGVFPHFSDEQVRHVVKKALKSLVSEGVLAYSLKINSNDTPWDYDKQGWDVMMPPDGNEVPRKLEGKRYYYIRSFLGARALGHELREGRTIGFLEYPTQRSQWSGAIICKDRPYYDIPENHTARSMPYPPLDINQFKARVPQEHTTQRDIT